MLEHGSKTPNAVFGHSCQRNLSHRVASALKRLITRLINYEVKLWKLP